MIFHFNQKEKADSSKCKTIHVRKSIENWAIILLYILFVWYRKSELHYDHIIHTNFWGVEKNKPPFLFQTKNSIPQLLQFSIPTQPTAITQTMSYHLNILSVLSRSPSPLPQPQPQPLQQQLLLSSSHPDPAPEDDKLARESDVTVSNITLLLEAEYRGFSIHIISTIGLIIWIIWTLLPDSLLHKLSTDYYPNKYWSIAIPSYSLMLMLFAYWVFALYNTEVLTLPLNDIHCIIDENSVFPGEKKVSQVEKQEEEEGEEEDIGGGDDSIMENSIEFIHKAPSGVWDLPITLVNDVLYE